MKQTGYMIVLLFAVAVQTAGCDETVRPIVPTGRPFSLYGYLDPRRDIQAIRVYPIEEALFPGANAQIDARLETVELPAGGRHAWVDSSIAFPFYYGAEGVDTTWGHVFWARFRPEFGSTVRITVTRSDGVRSLVDVELPDPVRVEVGPANAYPSNVSLPIRYVGDLRILTSSTIYTVSSPDADQPWVLELERLGPLPPYGSGESLLSVPLSVDLGRIFSATGLVPGVSEIYLLGVEVRTFLVHSSWNPPGGRFDPELLVDPFVFTNVENGFGYVGAGFTEVTPWIVDQDLAVLAGFNKLPSG